MPTIAGRTSFDFQRENINQQFSAQQQVQLEQLNAQLAAQGITGGAAVAAQQQMIMALQAQQGAALQDVNRQEAEYMQSAAMTEAQRRFTREERLGEQAYTAEMSYAQLNQREREIAENARQFDNRYDYDVWAKEQGYNEAERDRVWKAIQEDENRNLTAQELQLKVDDMRNQLNLDYEKLRTTTGVERDKLLVNIWQTEADIASAERRLAYESYAHERLTTLQSQLEQQNWEDQETIKRRETAYFNMGKAQVELDPAVLENLRTSDPLAYYAYMDGKANMSLVEFDANMDLRQNYLEAAIAGLSELTGDQFISGLGTVYDNFRNLFGPTGQFAGGFLGGMPVPTGFPGQVSSTGGGGTGDGGITGDNITQQSGPDVAGNEFADIPNTGTIAYVTGSAVQGFNITTMDTAQTGVSRLLRGRGAGATNQMGGVLAVNEFTPTYSYGSDEASRFIAAPSGNPADNYLYDEKTLISSINNYVTRIDQANGGFAYTVSAGGPTTNNPTRNAALWQQAIIRGEVDPDSFAAFDINYIDALMANNQSLVGYAGNQANIGGKPYSLGSAVDPSGNIMMGALMAVDVDDPRHVIYWIPGSGRYEVYNYARNNNGGGGHATVQSLVGNTQPTVGV